MEQVIALFGAASRAKAPFIIQTTPAARAYAGADMLVAMIRSAAAQYPDACFAVHLDHGNEDHVFHAIESGNYNSVMIDASHDIYESNIRRTKIIVDAAHEKSMEVEAELGVLKGVEDDLVSGRNRYTRPDEVIEFVKSTGCDSLAIAVGTSHGAYKFSGGQGLQFEILREIQRNLPHFPLVLHGGSAVNVREIGRINASGGRLKTGSRGVDPEELQEAIAYGICKVNIATDSRLIWTRVHREFFLESPESVDSIIPGKVYIRDMEDLFTEKFDLLGASGKVSVIETT